jgi:uncharacterized membrane protein YdfJ with MMPL/SSD domain
MDYQVFLAGRMREEWLRTHDARRAAHAGLDRGGGVIASAAIIMISVFGAMTMLGEAAWWPRRPRGLPDGTEVHERDRALI